MSGTRRESIVEVVTAIDKVDRQQWDALLRKDDSPFVEWDWLQALEQSGSATRKTGWAPSHMVIRSRGEDGSDGILAACPLYLKSHSMGEFVFDHGWADAAERAGLRYYPKLLAAVPMTPHTGRRFLVREGPDRPALIRALGQALVRLCESNRLSSVHVNFCLEEEARVLAELGFVERLGYQYHWRNDNFASFDDYLAQLKSKRRHAIRHERAELTRQGVNVRIFTAEQITPELLEQMFDIYRATVDKLYWGRQYLTREFFSMMRHFRRNLCLVCAFEGERLIAGTFNLRKAAVFYGRYWGTLRELKFLHFNVCYYEAIAHCIEHRLARFEPGAGGEYKWLRGFNPALTRSMHYLVHPGLRKAVDNFLQRERLEVQAWVASGTAQGQLKQKTSL